MYAVEASMSFHIPLHILPPTSTSITNFQVFLQDVHKGLPTSVRFTSMEVSMEVTSMDVGGRIFTSVESWWKKIYFHGS